MRKFVTPVVVLMTLLPSAYADLTVSGNILSSNFTVNVFPEGALIYGQAFVDTSMSSATVSYAYSQSVTLTAGEYYITAYPSSVVADPYVFNGSVDNTIAANAGLDSASLQVGLFDSTGTQLVAGSAVSSSANAYANCGFGVCAGVGFDPYAVSSLFSVAAGTYTLEETYSENAAGLPINSAVTASFSGGGGAGYFQLNQPLPTPEPNYSLMLAASVAGLLILRSARPRSRAVLLKAAE